MNEKTEMMADMVKNLAVLLLEQNNELSMEQALSQVFNSDTYQKHDSISKVRGMSFPF